MLTIGMLSRKTGAKVQTIRYYEQTGLMKEPGRTEGGQRRYFPADLDRLAFIRHGRQLGFALLKFVNCSNLLTTPNNPVHMPTLLPSGNWFRYSSVCYG